MRLVGPRSWQRRTLLIDSGHEVSRDTGRARNLKQLFSANGSDKSTQHNYEHLYAHLLASLPVGPMLEVGIGTRNPLFPSAMPEGYLQGGSLRAWSKLGQFSKVFGADIDPATLFTEVGIETFLVDQTKKESLRDLRNLVSSRCDGLAMIVDDGLHTLQANSNTAVELWPALSKDGVLVIEDITPDFAGSLIDVLLGLKPSSWGLFSDLLIKSDNMAIFARK